MRYRRMSDRRLMHPYAKVLDRNAFGSLAQLDARTLPGRLARDLGAELAEYIGGNPTIAQRLLIERIIKMKMQLDAFDAKLEKGPWTAHDTRTYGGINNAYRLTLRELDSTRPKNSRQRGPSLEEVITEHRRAV